MPRLPWHALLRQHLRTLHLNQLEPQVADDLQEEYLAAISATKEGSQGDAAMGPIDLFKLQDSIYASDEVLQFPLRQRLVGDASDC